MQRPAVGQRIQRVAAAPDVPDEQAQKQAVQRQHQVGRQEIVQVEQGQPEYGNVR